MNRRLLLPCTICGALIIVAVASAGRYLPWKPAGTGRASAADEHAPTLAGVLAAYGAKSRARFLPECRRNGITYPPKRLTLVVLKAEKKLEVWGANARGPHKRLAVYEVLAASGRMGPKRKEGDRQVPEGFYRISALNPASSYHLSLRVDYPNAEDIAHRTVARSAMGGDIYVHGRAVSIGCVAIGDPAIEEVFCLTAKTAAAKRRILIAPFDFRTAKASRRTDDAWLTDLYRRLENTLRTEYPVPG